MRNVRPPQSYRAYGSIKTYTREELVKMEERFKTTNLLTAFILGINLGVRLGECFALRFSDIDWEKETIRIIKLNKNLIERLKNLKNQYNIDKKIYGAEYKINTVMERRVKNSKLIVVDDFINISLMDKCLRMIVKKCCLKLVK